MCSINETFGAEFPSVGPNSDIPSTVIDMLTALVQKMVEESGNPNDFDSRTWMLDWLHSPIPALGGRRPTDYLHTPDGIDLISRMLVSGQMGAYW
ncbi:antitoxin Xre/MbcA/ParS toxin-binding domain-containing protein [Burkholderia lata]|uniref:antitoxin Xre/MbcA/ParS toxin-binding domain-containing protein n=1 Tax=Burkholderia lata (strain ATCC 17760 / DSM 23089 / LMG 22485 / NCIMB 9086 / R18194 / 383) TaxID=482957 RepID=UPI001582925C